METVAYDHLMSLESQLTALNLKTAGKIRDASNAINDEIALNDKAGNAVYLAVRDELSRLVQLAESVAYEAMRDDLADAWDAAKAEEGAGEDPLFGSPLGDENPHRAS